VGQVAGQGRRALALLLQEGSAHETVGHQVALLDRVDVQVEVQPLRVAELLDLKLVIHGCLRELLSGSAYGRPLHYEGCNGHLWIYNDVLVT